MSKKTPSQGFNYKFEIVFDKKKETTLQKIKRWISKQKPPLNIILKYLFSYIEKMYWDGKVLQTMAGVDLETKNYMNYGRQMTNKSPRTQWRQEYLERKAGLSKFQIRLLEEGPKSLSQAWYLGALHQDYEKMMGIKKTSNS